MLVLVLEDNDACLFYEALGGKRIGTVEIEIGGKVFSEVVFGWEEILKVDL